MTKFDYEPDNKWYKKYVVADDIWKEPVNATEEIVKVWREALFIHEKLQQQLQQLIYIGEL